jgi:hypothetical protein
MRDLIAPLRLCYIRRAAATHEAVHITDDSLAETMRDGMIVEDGSSDVPQTDDAGRGIINLRASAPAAHDLAWQSQTG